MESAHSQPVDRISKMPESVIDDILMRLTTLEAAKTCILSKKWRYKWAKLPQLIIDNALWRRSEWRLHPGEFEEIRMKFLLFLDRVLLHHEGPTTKLSFVVPELESNSRIGRLIDLLSDHGVEEFAFGISSAYKLPSSLFLYSQLKRLQFFQCFIRPPPLTFDGFHRLVRLELYDVDIDDEVLERLVSSSPKLEQLLLSGTYGFDRFEIDAPMLKFLYFKCYCATIRFKTPRLEAVEVVSGCAAVELLQHGNYNFVEFFDSLPALCKLSTDSYFIQVLAAGQVQARIPSLLIHLKTLKVSYMDLGELVQLSCVISLIRSSPNLEELEIMSYGWEAPDAPLLEFLEVQDYSNVLLNQLQKVKLSGITGTVPEIALIKLLLEKSSKLESMAIDYCSLIQANIMKGRKVVEEVNNFVALSPYAKVIHKFVG